MSQKHTQTTFFFISDIFPKVALFCRQSPTQPDTCYEYIPPKHDSDRFLTDWWRLSMVVVMFAIGVVWIWCRWKHCIRNKGPNVDENGSTGRVHHPLWRYWIVMEANYYILIETKLMPAAPAMTSFAYVMKPVMKPSALFDSDGRAGTTPMEIIRSWWPWSTFRQRQTDSEKWRRWKALIRLSKSADLSHSGSECAVLALSLAFDHLCFFIFFLHTYRLVPMRAHIICMCLNRHIISMRLNTHIICFKRIFNCTVTTSININKQKHNPWHKEKKKSSVFHFSTTFFFLSFFCVGVDQLLV